LCSSKVDPLLLVEKNGGFGEDGPPSKCIINDKFINVLYDSGVSHSFISLDYLKNLDLPLTPMPYDIVVTTHTDKSFPLSYI